MIAIQKKCHTEKDIYQQGPKNLDSFRLNSVSASLVIYYFVLIHHLEGSGALQFKIFKRKYVRLLIKNFIFRTPQEEYYMYPTWLFLYIQVIVLPIIWLSAMATKILMKKEMKRYFFGNSVHPVHF